MYSLASNRNNFKKQREHNRGIGKAMKKDQEGTMTLLAPKGLQNPDCLTPVAILSPVVRGNKLAERKGNVAIYQGPYPGAFEVIVIRVAEESVFAGKVVPRREVYPSAEAWGTYGWTYSPASHANPLKAAREKMKQLTRRAILNYAVFDTRKQTAGEIYAQGKEQDELPRCTSYKRPDGN
jgi:hypothetical protein